MPCRRLCLACLILGLSACGPEEALDPRMDLAVKQFKARPGMAGVVIFRNQHLGGMLRLKLELDGQPLGQTAAMSYLYKDLTPGPHTITSSAEVSHSLKLNARPGEIYYVWQEVRMGVLYGRTRLHLVSTEVGKKAVLELRGIPAM